MVEILNDHFEVIRTLGEGGQGRAFLARDIRGGEEVVVKELLVGRAADWKAIELFERETTILKNLSHPAIPGYVDGFHLDEGGRVFLVQEYIAGHSLDALIEAGELFDEAGIREFLGQMLDILIYLQGFSPPVIHRDLKPSNIIRDADGKYHLVDFGAVQLIIQDDVGGSTIVGTSGFMPPEQLMGRAQPASDIYSLGATCVQMACGIEPGDLPMERMRLQFRDLVGLSDELCDLLEKMLEPQVAARFTDARAVQDALETGKVEPAPSLDAAARDRALATIRQKVAAPPVSIPMSEVNLDADGALNIETVKVYNIPIISMGLAIVVGSAMIYSGFNGGDGGACCTGFPLVFASVGFLFYRTIKRFKQYVQRLRVSEDGIELEAGERTGASGSLSITKQIQIPLYQLRHCYLHTYNPLSQPNQSLHRRAQSRKESGIRFTDTAGREHAFHTENLLTRGKRWLSETEQTAGPQEVLWLFELVQAQLEALTAAPDVDDKTVLQLDGDDDDDENAGEEEIAEAPDTVGAGEGPAW